MIFFSGKYGLNILYFCYLKFQYISDEVANKIKTNKN